MGDGPRSRDDEVRLRESSFVRRTVDMWSEQDSGVGGSFPTSLPSKDGSYAILDKALLHSDVCAASKTAENFILFSMVGRIKVTRYGYPDIAAISVETAGRRDA